MSGSFKITVDSGHLGQHRATLEETNGPSTNSVVLHGRTYAVHVESQEALPVVLDTLNALYPGAVTTSEPLAGRVSKEEARVLPLWWGERSQVYLADFRERIASAYLAKGDLDSEAFIQFCRNPDFALSLPENFDAKVRQAFGERDTALFAAVLEPMPEWWLMGFRREEKLNTPARMDPISHSFFSAEALQELDEHIHHPVVGFSGVAVLEDAHGMYAFSSEEIEPNTPFSIQSLGKVLTGMLVFELIHKGLIPESALMAPLELDLRAIQELAKRAPSVLEHLRENKISLEELLTHSGGLGEYLDLYRQNINEALAEGRTPPSPRDLVEFLQFAEDATYPVGESHYSNLGFLLIGLSLEHLTQTPFDTLLQKHIVEPSHISCSSEKPEGGKFNPETPEAPYMLATPAGGFWMTAANLCKFGSWAAGQCNDPAFKGLLNVYKPEFWFREEIYHEGSFSTTACLSASPACGVTIAVLSSKICCTSRVFNPEAESQR